MKPVVIENYKQPNKLWTKIGTGKLCLTALSNPK